MRTPTPIDKATRQASFNRLLERATKAAADSGEMIQLIFAPIYVDEHDEGFHVYCPAIARDTLYPHHAWMSDDEYMIDASIKPDGSILYSVEVCGE